MHTLTVDLRGLEVLVLGDPASARRALRRATHEGAIVVHWSTPDEARAALEAGGPGTRVRLVIAVDDGHPDWGQVLDRLRPAYLVTTAPAAMPEGRVTLVGSGPGDPALLTEAARIALADADVVLHDRLGALVDLAALTGGAELVDVGKHPGHHPVGQREIEALIVEHARAGSSVVRLKGGDPFVFGRGGEEVLAAVRAGIPVSVVPGVTSAVAVPAAGGVPVTQRGVSRSFTVLSGHVPLSDAEAQALTALETTIVMLMAVGSVHQSAAALTRAGMSGTTPVCVVEQGCTPAQRTTRCTLATLSDTVVTHAVRSPAVIVVGEVVDALDGWLPAAAAESRTPAET